jgi:hypothetical protein
MTELVQSLRKQPLVHVLTYLTEATGRHEFRDLSAPIWVSTKKLDLTSSDSHVRHISKQALGRFHCPVGACTKHYKYHRKLSHHLYKHDEIRKLPDEVRDHVMNDLVFNVPTDCGIRGTVLAPEAFTALQRSRPTQSSASL